MSANVSDAGMRGQGTAPSQRDIEAGQRVSAQAELDHPKEVIALINQHLDAFGVEPICKALQVAPSGFHLHAAR